MSECTCDKNMKLQLGFSHFPAPGSDCEEEDPLVSRFQEARWRWSFQNPATKTSERLGVLEVIAAQSRAGHRAGDGGSFKMFPPVILPQPDLAHGHPGHLVQELQYVTIPAPPQEAREKKLKKKRQNSTKAIEDPVEYKRSWLQSYQEQYAETTVTQVCNRMRDNCENIFSI